MKLVRFGPVGQEKPGLLDCAGQLRDLSRQIPDLGPDQLSQAVLASLRLLESSGPAFGARAAAPGLPGG